MSGVRTDFTNALANVAMEVVANDFAGVFNQYDPIYPKICQVKNVADISRKKGAFWSGVPVIGNDVFEERTEGGAIQFDDPTEGYVRYGKVRSYDIGTQQSLELNRDFVQMRNMITKFVRDVNYPKMAITTKEKIVAKLFNRGAYTAGDAIFNQDVPGTLTTDFGNLAYDNKPFFNATGNNRSAKGHSTTYFNMNGAKSLDFTNLLASDVLLTSTNAYDEVGNPFDNTRNLKLMVPTALKNTASPLINSTLRPDNNNNSTNALMGEYEVIVNPYLTDTDAWFVGNDMGIWFWDSNEIQFDIWEVHETRQIRIAAHLELAFAVVEWRSWVGNNMSAS